MKTRLDSISLEVKQ